MDELISRAEVMKHMHFRRNEKDEIEGYVRTKDILSIPAMELDSKNQDVNRLIDEVLENDNLQASPTVWHCLHRLKELPSAERKGKWMPLTNGRGGNECDQCHAYAPSYKSGHEWLSNFCPNCGADMREGQVSLPDDDSIYG